MTKTKIRKRWQRMKGARFDRSAVQNIISKTICDVGGVVVVRRHVVCISHDRLGSNQKL